MAFLDELWDTPRKSVSGGSAVRALAQSLLWIHHLSSWASSFASFAPSERHCMECEVTVVSRRGVSSREWVDATERVDTDHPTVVSACVWWWVTDDLAMAVAAVVAVTVVAAEERCGITGI